MAIPTSPAPGWYHDAIGVLRYWDGSHWTEHTAASPTPQPFPPPAPRPPATPLKETLSVWWSGLSRIQRRLTVGAAATAVVVVGIGVFGGALSRINENPCDRAERLDANYYALKAKGGNSLDDLKDKIAEVTRAYDACNATFPADD